MAATSRGMADIAMRIRTEHPDFAATSSLEHAIPGTSEGATRILPPGLLGPDLDAVSTLLAGAIKGPYAAAAGAVEDLLVRTAPRSTPSGST